MQKIEQMIAELQQKLCDLESVDEAYDSQILDSDSENSKQSKITKISATKRMTKKVDPLRLEFIHQTQEKIQQLRKKIKEIVMKPEEHLISEMMFFHHLEKDFEQENFLGEALKNFT